jgi:Family of unknown function (DUF6010)
MRSVNKYLRFYLNYLAYWGLRDYRFIGIGWLLHTVWDVSHYLYGTPIVLQSVFQLVCRGIR